VFLFGVDCLLIGSSGLKTALGIAFYNSNNTAVISTPFDIRIFNISTGAYITTYGSYGSGNGEFDIASDVYVNQTNGNIFVLETNNNRIQVLSSTGSYLYQFGNGLYFPSKMDVDETTKLMYITDTHNNKIQVYSTTGTYKFSFSNNTPLPFGIAVYGNSVLVSVVTYVAATANFSFQIFDVNGTFVATIDNPYYANSINSVVNNDIEINKANGATYIMSNYNDLFLYSINTSSFTLTPTGFASSYQGSFGSAIAIAPGGGLWIGSYDTPIVAVTDANGNVLSLIKPAFGELVSIYDICLDSNDNIYVSDIALKLIYKYDKNGNCLLVLGVTTPQKQYYAMAVNPVNGYLYVADDYALINVFDTNSGALVRSFGGAGYGNGLFYVVSGITVTELGVICIIDTYTRYIQQFSSNGTHEIFLSQLSIANYSNPSNINYSPQLKLLYVTDVNNGIFVLALNWTLKSFIAVPYLQYSGVDARNIYILTSPSPVQTISVLNEFGVSIYSEIITPNTGYIQSFSIFTDGSLAIFNASLLQRFNAPIAISSTKPTSSTFNTTRVSSTKPISASHSTDVKNNNTNLNTASPYYYTLGGVVAGVSGVVAISAFIFVMRKYTCNRDENDFKSMTATSFIAETPKTHSMGTTTDATISQTSV